MRHGFLVIAAVLVVGCGLVFVQRVVVQQAVEQRFEQLDRNGDATVTPDQLSAATLFRRLDLDGDGAITKAEAVEAIRQGAIRDHLGRGLGELPAESAPRPAASPGQDPRRAIRTACTVGSGRCAAASTPEG